jgi:(1->4)-alpha-D-glucan 1-alpha-D-glucosylmutase
LRSNPALLHELTFIRRFLLLDFPENLSDEERRNWIQFVMRFQQHTGPLMAKGFEDTMMYVYNRFLSLNEVGGAPDKFGCSLSEFHDFNRERNDSWPASLNATSTHDTKRGEDVRARINVLSEVPEEWNRSVKAWFKMNRFKKSRVAGIFVPDKNDEYFLYQTLVGALPFLDDEYPSFVERIKEYVIKAVREAKVHTAWLKPDTDYEDAYVSFVEKILTPSDDNTFLAEFRQFAREIAHYGILNSLSQTLIKITAPGVPDFYRGCELWDLSLVDPDNRRPVDFQKRRELLDTIREEEGTDLPKLMEGLLASPEDGSIKLFLIYMALRARKTNSHVFREGMYLPLEADGAFKDHIVSFARRHGADWAVTITPRFPTGLVRPGEFPLGAAVWLDTAVITPAGAPYSWRNALTGAVVSGSGALQVGEVLRDFPCVLLTARSDEAVV